MVQFADEALIEVRSGKGGNGCIAFRREKYIPRGGPNGGDGGKGGDVVFCVRRNMRTLAKLRNQVVFKAKNGGDGSGWNKYGKDGEDVVIAVPPGTTIRDAETDELIHDFTDEDENERFVFLSGGKGGWGNVHFKSSTNQAPRYAHPGTPGEVRKLRLELSIIADAGLVGFPNAGKSSLLNAFTNARPKIAPYPFTTKIPNLGVLRVDGERDIIIADIPGIIEGASEGAGLGFKFLKHISRTACLIYMIDCSDESCMTAYAALKKEIASYSSELAAKPKMVLCNKIDVEGAAENAQKIIKSIREAEKETPVIAISVTANMNMRSAKIGIIDMVDAASGAHTAACEGGDMRGNDESSFLSTRSVDESMETQYPGDGAFMKIALLGGAFNPLHIGHAMLAEIAAGELGFDKVLFVPTFIPPHKRFADAASAKDRLGMVKAFCKDSPHFAAEACEIERGGVSYTFDTLQYIIKKFGDSIEGKPALIIGEENAREFEKWYRASDVASLADIVIARRQKGAGGQDVKAFQNTPVGNYTGGFDGGVESVFFPFPHRLLDNPPLTLSSTEIRSRIGSGKSWRYLVPESVFRYIIRKRLYGYGRF